MGGSSICISGEDPESKPLSTVEIIVDCSVATQQVMLEFCETVGIVGYLSSRDVLTDDGGRRHLRPSARSNLVRSQRDVTEQNSEQPPPLALPFHSMLKIERKVPFRIEHH